MTIESVNREIRDGVSVGIKLDEFGEYHPYICDSDKNITPIEILAEFTSLEASPEKITKLWVTAVRIGTHPFKSHSVLLWLVPEKTIRPKIEVFPPPEITATYPGQRLTQTLTSSFSEWEEKFNERFEEIVEVLKSATGQ